MIADHYIIPVGGVDTSEEALARNRGASPGTYVGVLASARAAMSGRAWYGLLM